MSPSCCRSHLLTAASSSERGAVSSVTSDETWLTANLGCFGDRGPALGITCPVSRSIISSTVCSSDSALARVRRLPSASRRLTSGLRLIEPSAKSTVR